VRRYGRVLHLSESHLTRAHAFFARHGPKTIFIGRFIALLRTWAAVLAGAAQMPYGTFMLYNALGAVCWSVIFGTLGYVFGRNLPHLATFLLTGGRRAEVLGLEVDDVSFDRKTVTFRPNCWRRLKTASSFRTVPLWAQLEETLQPYVFGDRPPSRLLFPSYVGGREAMLVDIRKLIDAVATRAGRHAGEITSKIFRHTYCAARLQTIDRGAPASV
jgi:integrase